MNQQTAIATIKNAVTYSTFGNPQKELNNAINCLAELKGWTKEDVYIEFVDHCLKGAEEWKADPMHTYMLKDANDASNVALYLDNQAANDIEDLRK